MKHYFACIAALLLIIIPTMAQEETSVCGSPFTTGVPEEEVIMSIDDNQVTGETFANRFRFEHAYNAIKYEIRITQLQTIAEEAEIDASNLIANDTQIRQMNAENDNQNRLANRILNNFGEDYAVWSYASENDIRISQEEFDETINDFFNTADATAEERDSIINSFTQRILSNGTPPAEITTFFCRQALYERVKEAVITDSDTVTYANVDHILVSTPEVAQDIITLINEGEDFAALARELSLDVASVDSGGALGDQALYLFVAEFAEAISNAEIGSITGPVETRFGWHVIIVNSREERPVADETQRQELINSEFTYWREAQFNAASITVNPNWQSFIPVL